MTRKDFWQLISTLIGKTHGDLGNFESALDRHLQSLPPNEIEDFARHYAELQNEANTPGILEAAFIIGCGASNDGFMDFRRWIVFQGGTAFEKIVANPDYLGTYDRRSDPIEHWYCEYDPRWAYEEVAGEELPYVEIGVYPDAKTDYDNEEVLAARYPKLWARCRG